MTAIMPPVVSKPGLAAKIKRNPEELLISCAAEYGDVFTVALDDGHRMTYILDPHAFQSLLSSPQIDFSPVSRQSKLRFGLGNIVSTNERVRNLSQALTGGLRGSQLSDTLLAFDEELQRMVTRYAAALDGPTRRTVQHISQQTLMPATVYALFGEGVYDDDFVSDFFAYSSSIATRFAGSDPSLSGQGVAAERSLMTRLAVCLRRVDTPVLSALSQRLVKDGSVTDDERLRTLLMLMWGSMVNLVPTSVWMYASILADKNLVGEIRRSRDSDSGSHLRRSIVTETLRLFSRPNMYREVTENFDLELSDGRRIRLTGGDWIALFPRILHHDPEVFHNAMRFDARRFCPVDDDSNKPPTFQKGGAPLRHATMIFGLGRGRCPGDAYSQSVLDRLIIAWTSAFDASLAEMRRPKAITDTVSSTPGPDRNIEILVQAVDSN